MHVPEVLGLFASGGGDRGGESCSRSIDLIATTIAASDLLHLAPAGDDEDRDGPDEAGGTGGGRRTGRTARSSTCS
jgi:hypothetical protein